MKTLLLFLELAVLAGTALMNFAVAAHELRRLASDGKNAGDLIAFYLAIQNIICNFYVFNGLLRMDAAAMVFLEV